MTARIFRLIETAAEQAILSGKERLDLQSFGDDLILPLHLDNANRGTTRREGGAAGSGMMGRLPVAPRPYRDELLSSWLGQVACRYGLDAESLVDALGVADGEGDAHKISIDDAAPSARRSCVGRRPAASIRRA